MYLEEAIDYITFLFEEDNDENLFLRWVNGYQDTMTFDKFKEELNARVFEPKSEKEILGDVFDIIRLTNGG